MHFDMQPRVVKANEKVVADRGRVAVERGPIVYCAEADNDFNIQNIILNRHPKFQVTRSLNCCMTSTKLPEVQALGFDAAGKVGNQRCDADLIPLLWHGHTGVRARCMYGCR